MDRGMKKVYELEELGIITQEPIKAFGEMQMCAKPNIERMEEWLDNRTIDGKKMTKKQGEMIDEFVYLCMFTKTVEGEILGIFKNRMNDPKFLKWQKKQARKYLLKFQCAFSMDKD